MIFSTADGADIAEELPFWPPVPATSQIAVLPAQQLASGDATRNQRALVSGQKKWGAERETRHRPRVPRHHCAEFVIFASIVACVKAIGALRVAFS